MRSHLVLAAFVITPAPVADAELQEVASFPDQQLTGVGVSTKSVRIFVNFPYFSDSHSISVAEIISGRPKAFPNEDWNMPGLAGSHFICVQSVVVDDQDNLWVLDSGSLKMQGTAYWCLNLPREMFQIRQKPGLVPSLRQREVETVRLGVATTGERRKRWTITVIHSARSERTRPSGVPPTHQRQRGFPSMLASLAASATVPTVVA